MASASELIHRHARPGYNWQAGDNPANQDDHMPASSDDQSRSLNDLLRVACGDPEADETWAAVQALHTRGDDAVFSAAMQLARSEDVRERMGAASILGQIAYQTPGKFDPQRLALLISLLDDADATVIAAAAFGLGHCGGAAALPSLLRRVSHSDRDVRHGVAFALGRQHDRAAEEALIVLSRDPADDVRDWATFGLGHTNRPDRPEIREALFARLGDAHQDTRMEALTGLAQRKDDRAFDELVRQLAVPADEVVTGHFEAATAFADPRLLPRLVEIRDATESDADSYWKSMLNEAIVACGGEADPAKEFSA